MSSSQHGIGQYQGITGPGQGLELKDPTRLEIALAQLETADARLGEIVRRAREQLAPITQPRPARPDLPPGAADPDRETPHVGASTGRVHDSTYRINALSDALIELLDALDV